MSYTEDQLWGLLREANDMPYGAAQIALVEQVMAHADALHATELSYQSRMIATNAYNYGGEPAKSFVSFSWCLAEYDRDPVAYANSTHTLMWHFKYMVSALRKFPEIPLERAYAVLDDMERRWRAGGHSMHAIYAYRHKIARHIGDEAASEHWFQQWSAAKRDDLSDCVGCDPTSKAYWLSSQGRDEEAVALAAPLLAGHMTCTEQPQSILTALLVPYLRTGRFSEAAEAHRRAYRLMRPNLADMSAIAEHISFCGLTGNEARGLEIIERHLPWLDIAPSPMSEMNFSAAAASVLRRLDEAGHGATVIHRAGHGTRAAAKTTVAALAVELAAVASEIAARFDRRNGTNYQGAQVAEVLSAQPLVESLPLSVSIRPNRAAAAPAPVAVLEPAAALEPTLAQATPQAAAIPTTATGDELLDLAEEYARTEQDMSLAAAVTSFDDRFASVELTSLQRGRRADLHGYVAANSNDLAVAELSWSSALDLFAAAGDEERRQATRARLGVLMCRTDRAEVGLPITQDATDYLIAHAPLERRSSAHRRLAVAYLMAGRADEAIEAIDEAARFAAGADTEMMPVRVAVDRAMFLAQIGRVDEAADDAQSALAACRVSGYRRGIAAASWVIGRLAGARGEVDEATAAFDDAIAHSEDPAFTREARRQRASLLAGSERAADAIEDLAEEVATAVAAHEDDAVATARFYLAMAYLNAERAFDAADVLEELLAAIDADSPDAEQVHHMLSNAYRALGQPDQAISQLEIIAASGARRGHLGLVGEMNEQIAELLDHLDRDSLAAKRFAEASAAYRQADEALLAARTARRAAVSHMWAGQLDDAVEGLGAADLAALDLEGGGDPEVRWERAMLAVDGARILARNDDLSTAALRIAPAAAVFAKLGDEGAAAFAAVTHGEILLEADRPAEAEPLLRNVLDGQVSGAIATRTARALAHALDHLGRRDEANQLRKAHQLEQ